MGTKHEIVIMHPLYGRVGCLQSFASLITFAERWHENHNEDLMLSWTFVDGKLFNSWDNMKKHLAS